MSFTVGTPTAIAAQLILDGKIGERGVIMPKYPDIYEPVL
jgi:saccharopine dehydrogenase-like NADP-dependent oxidoreductase